MDTMKQNPNPLKTMKRKEFESLDDISLVWECIEPVIQPIRGSDIRVKLTVYEKLAPPQRALMMFQVLYGHTHGGITQFYNHFTHILTKPGVWQQFKAGLKYFGDNNMSQILEEMEEAYKLAVSKQDGEQELYVTINQLDARFREAVPETVKQVGQYIRNHPEDFARIVD